jgi:hypothetical protein
MDVETCATPESGLRCRWTLRLVQIDSSTSARIAWSSRFALVAGFGGLLGIVALSGVDALRVLRQIRQEDDQIRTQFLSRNHVLNDIRSQLYLSGT